MKIVRDKIITLSELLEYINLPEFKEFISDYKLTSHIDVFDLIIEWGKLNDLQLNIIPQKDLMKISEFIYDNI